MKRLFAILCTTICLVGCTVENPEIDRVNAPKEIYWASFEDFSETSRTYLDENVKLLWHADDRISLFRTTFNEEFEFTGDTGANSGGFEEVSSDNWVTGNAVSTNYAVYPYSETNALSNSEVISLTMPAVQQYAANSFGKGANTMVAASESSTSKLLPFRNVGGYLIIKLYGENTTIKSIALSGNNNEVIAGAATSQAKYGYLPTLTMSEEGTKTITLDCGELGVTISSDSENPTSFWMVVPPITFENGFTLTITDINDNTTTKSTSKSQTIERNAVKSMAAFQSTFEGETEDPEADDTLKIFYNWYTSVTDGIYEIDTPEELVALSKLTNGDTDALSAVGADTALTFEGKTINLTADIDLSDFCSTLAGSWTPIGAFYGTFNGNNHKINNLYINSTSRGGIFASLTNATIKNMFVQGEITCTSNADVGGIAAYASSSLFENCISDVNITSKSNSGSDCGGICGGASNSDFIACQSLGDITSTTKESWGTPCLGGIVGSDYNSSVNLIGCCKLQGYVEETNGYNCIPSVGGILGKFSSKYAGYIQSCYVSAIVYGGTYGYITNSGTTRYYSEDKIADCYYVGASGKGIGKDRDYYPQDTSYDNDGTISSTDIAAEIVIMNNGINEWNAANPDCICNYKYELDSNNVPVLVKQTEN